MMNSSELRESFLDFFELKKHTRFPSGSLVPEKDPSLFFTNAGMVPFKNVFTGQEDIGTRRATSSQKCMRVSGKHNDLENVGRTARHHTFFEMLGNFSFGDYFKVEAIRFAWEYLTEVLKISKERLWVTVFREDDEAEKLWLQETDVSASRILRFDEADNFWSMGPTGPCGPCTEIHFDHGDNPEKVTGQFFREHEHSDRFMEIWNLVFMQFNREESGKLNPLPKPSVDTGMGIERLACVVQNVQSNYDTDFFTPLLSQIAQITSKFYGENEKHDISMRVIADHIRATGFLIADGVLPSNEGRGYVLRRIMRRAMRHGRLLGLHQPFFFKILPTLIDQMGQAYPELNSHQKFIEKVTLAEEQRFLETLERGLEILESEIEKTRDSEQKVLSGSTAFKLYDTFGFPLDLTQTILEEAGMEVRQEEFEKLMEEQRKKARLAWKGSGAEKSAEVHQQLVAEGLTSEFLGYQTLDCFSKVTALIQQGKRLSSASEQEEVEVYMEYTPFYAESGGQVGDQGELISPQVKGKVLDTQNPLPGLISHRVHIYEGTLNVGDEVHLKVNFQRRNPTRLNHTATHLLHAALRQILGEHVKQAGSLVTPDRLRFDFSHFKLLNSEEILKIENLVNEKILQDIEVEKKILSYQEAIEQGAMALFGEKYGDQVRVLKIDDFSVELCGGTHVDRTGEIGSFKIINESSVAAGVRRIEAITGVGTLEYLRSLEKKVQEISHTLKVGPDEIVERLSKQNQQLKKAEKELRQLKTKLIAAGPAQSSKKPSEQAQEINGVKVLSLRRDVDDVTALRALSDQLIDQLKSGICVIGAEIEGKATLIVRVSKDLTDRFHAGKIIKQLASLIGGKGGGRPDMAQAGGTAVNELDKALEKATELI